MAQVFHVGGCWQDSDMSESLGPADLTRSIFASLGLETDNPLQISTSEGPEILLLIDGFGSFVFDEFADHIPTITRSSRAHQESLASHFPSTTVSNLTSLGTGERPGVHGMVGYTMRIPFATEGTPQLLNGLKWDPRIDPATWQRHPTLFEKARNIGIDVNHIAAKRYEGSGFTEAALRGATYRAAQGDDEILAALEEVFKTRSSFTYLYLNDVDEAGHGYGVGSNKWLEAVQRVDGLVAKIVTTMPKGSRLWVTADHGMVNAGQKVVLGSDNRLLHGVALLGGEPRARHLYISRDLPTTGFLEEVERVRARWHDFFGDRIELLSPDQAYGEVTDSAIRERIGDIIAVPVDDTVLIEPERQDAQARMVGHHGAMTEAESRIPLRVIER